MKTIGVITNITSGKNKKGRHLRKRLSAVFGETAHVVKTRDIPELRETIHRFREQRIEVLCIDGGDGTIQKVLTEWILQEQREDTLPIVIPLRGGTSNATAIDFGIRGTAEEIGSAVVALVSKVREGEYLELPTMTRNLLRIEASFHDRVEYGFISATGIVYKGVHHYRQKGDPTIRTAFMVMAEIVATALLHGRESNGLFEMVPATLTVDGRRILDQSWTGVLASSLNRLLFKITPFYPENLSKEGFNFAALSIPAWEAVKHAYDLFRGKRSAHLPPELFINDRVREVIIESREGFMLDGELFSCSDGNTVRITHGPRVRVLKLPELHLAEQFQKWAQLHSLLPTNHEDDDGSPSA